MADYTLSAKITGDASGFTKAFDQAKQRLQEVSSNVTSAGKKMSSIGKSISGVGDTLTRKITTPAVAATSALVGVTLVKGFSRLVGIDTARAKLQGLGHDSNSVEKIMVSALDSVRGTAFGMDEAATTAANAVAAGIPPGKELTRYLTLTGDAAAIAGSSMSEMGSIVNKVTTAGKAYNGELQQLSDRGLPIYSWIAKEAGIAEDAVFDFASNGKVSSEMLLNAIESNIGGAAKIMGETSFTAAVANVGAAVGRIGASFLDAGGKGGGFFSTVKPMLSDFITALDSIEPIAADLGVKFGTAFSNIISTISNLKARFDGLSPSMQSLILKGTAIGSAIAVGIGPALKIVGKLTSIFGSLVTVVGFMISPVGLVIAAVIGLGIAFTAAMIKSESFRNTIITIGKTIATIAQIIWAFFMDFQNLSEPLNALQNILPPSVASSITQGLMSILVPIWSIGAAIKTIIQIASGSITSLSEVEGAMDGAFGSQGIMRIVNIGMALKGFGERVFELASSAIPMIQGAFQKMGPAILDSFSTIGTQIGAVFTTIWGIIQAVVPIFTSFFSALISGFGSADNAGSGFSINLTTILFGLNPVIKGVILLFQNFGPQIVAAFQQVATMIIPLVVTIGTAIGQLATAIIPLVMQAMSTLIPVVMQVGLTFMNIITAVLPVLISLFSQFVPIIVQVVLMFANIIAQVVPLVGVLISALLPVIQSVIQAFMNVVTAVAPAFIAIIQMIMSVIQALVPVFMAIVTTVVHVFAMVISTISPIVAFIGTIISGIMAMVSPIVAFIAGIISSIVSIITPIITIVTGIFTTVFTVISGIWQNIMTFIGIAINAIGTVISGLTSVVSGVFNTIFSTVSGIMNSVSSTISGVFEAIKSSWNGLTTFVSNIFDGISGSVQTLVSQVKGFVNGVIGGINSAIGLINKIPGVNIGTIPYLARGTDNFGGGFARINEGGRGELVIMPGGTQVIPHDVSMKYAKESAHASSGRGFQGNRSEVVYEGDVNVTIEKFENHTDKDVEILAYDLGWQTKRERTRLENA